MLQKSTIYFLVFVLVIAVFVQSVHADESYGFVTKWDIKDSEQKAGYSPVGISLDTEGNVYTIEEYSGQIKKYSPDGEFLASFGGNGSSKGQLSGANGIAIDSNNNIYVPVWTSGEVYNIQKMKNDGSFVNKLVEEQKYVSIKNVYDLAVDSQNNLYAVNYYSSKFYKWASDGTFIKSWEYPKKDAYTIGDPDAYLRPWDIAIDSKNNLYVVDRAVQYGDGGRIQKYSSDGTFITRWGTSGKGEGQLDDPQGVAVDSQGNVYVADSGNDRILKFSSDGTFITQWDEKSAHSTTETFSPTKLVVDRSGNVYVLEDTGIIQKFAIRTIPSSTVIPQTPVSTSTFISKWGFKGGEDAEYKNFKPTGIVTDSKNNIYIADTGNEKIWKFTSDGTFVKDWGSRGTGNSQFSYPQGIAADSKDFIYVTDSGNNRIQKFSSDGIFVKSWGSPGTGDMRFEVPRGIAIDSKDNVYIVDFHFKRIWKFTSDGTFITKWGDNMPQGSQIYGLQYLAVDSKDNVYLTESAGVAKFTSDGSLIKKFDRSGDGRLESPMGICIDLQDNVYVVSSMDNKIKKFSSDGGYITTFGSGGTGDGQFMSPSGIAVDSNGFVYISDTENQRIQKLSIPLTAASKNNNPVSGTTGTQNIPANQKNQNGISPTKTPLSGIIVIISIGITSMIANIYRRN